MNKLLLHPLAKPVLWLALASPLAWLVWGAVQNTLGANPAEALIRALGDWTLRLLVLTLAITPMRHWTGWHALARFRRNVGVAAFLYATLHWLAYAWLDQGLDAAALWQDVLKRPFILVGTLAWLMLVPLAATSFNAAMKALGGRAWQRLHQLSYAIILLGLLHFFWMRAGKQDFAEVAIYAAIVAVLLGWRLRLRWAKTASAAAKPK